MLAKNDDPDKYVYRGYGTLFDSRSLFSLPNFDWDKNVIIFGIDVRSSVTIDNTKKNILIFGKGPTQGLDNTTLTAEAPYSINFSRSNRKFCLGLYYNGSSSFLFVHATKIYQFKTKYSDMKKHPFCLGNIPGSFSVNNLEKKQN